MEIAFRAEARAAFGKRNPVACWLRHSAATNFVYYEQQFASAKLQKFAMAECHALPRICLRNHSESPA